MLPFRFPDLWTKKSFPRIVLLSPHDRLINREKRSSHQGPVSDFGNKGTEYRQEYLRMLAVLLKVPIPLLNEAAPLVPVSVLSSLMVCSLSSPCYIPEKEADRVTNKPLKFFGTLKSFI